MPDVTLTVPAERVDEFQRLAADWYLQSSDDLKDAPVDADLPLTLALRRGSDRVVDQLEDAIAGDASASVTADSRALSFLTRAFLGDAIGELQGVSERPYDAGYVPDVRAALAEVETRLRMVEAVEEGR